MQIIRLVDFSLYGEYHVRVVHRDKQICVCPVHGDSLPCGVHVHP
jgi:hypothetical protein